MSGIFPSTDATRLKEVVNAINENSLLFGINTIERMSHFIGQIGAETGGLKKLTESPNYTFENIYNTCLKPNLRNHSKSTTGKTFKYCDFIEGFSCTDISTDKCSDNPTNSIGHADCHSVVNVQLTTDKKSCSWIYSQFDSLYNIKSSYKGTVIFDYWYGCRMGNGPKTSGNGSTYMGKGFIHLTGKDMYRSVSNAWTQVYGKENTKEFHGKDIGLLENDVEIAIKASMAFWKVKNLNEEADKGGNEAVIKKITKLVNGGDNGLTNRMEYTNLSIEKLK